MTALPPDISSLFAPTPDTLWAIWVRSDPDMVSVKWTAEVTQEWVLASRGEAGLKEIQSRDPEGAIIAAVPFAQIDDAHRLLEASQRSRIASLIPQWFPLGEIADFRLVKKGDTLEWETSGKEGTDPVVLEGRKRDFDRLWASGKELIAAPNYAQVFMDCRPPCEGHPSDWLEIMTRPDSAITIRAATEALSQEAWRE